MNLTETNQKKTAVTETYIWEKEDSETPRTKVQLQVMNKFYIIETIVLQMAHGVYTVAQGPIGKQPMI